MKMTDIKKHAALVVGLVAAVGISAAANQSSLSKVGMTVRDVQTWATRSVIASTDVEGPMIRFLVPCVPASAVNAIQAMAPAERLALTQEVLTAVKAAVSTPAFKTEHAAYIKETRNAVDHGTVAPERFDAIRNVIVPLIDMLRTFPIEALRQTYDNDRDDLRETIKNETGNERSKAQKDLARLDALAPLMKSNPEEFRKQYIVAKSVSMGGPDTEARLAAMTASREDSETVRLQQNNWNHWNLTEMIKKNLAQYLDLASKVQPSGKYECDNQSLNANYDKGSLNALMNVVGAGPINAAATFTRAWLKELER